MLAAAIGREPNRIRRSTKLKRNDTAHLESGDVTPKIAKFLAEQEAK